MFWKIAIIVAFNFCAAFGAGPCCAVTGIDAKTGIVAAKENSSGRVFQFSANAVVLKNLRVGQSVYANFTSQQVSVNGAEPCCAITNSSNPPPGTPCCGVISIDTAKGIATARENSTGRTFDFRVGDAALLKTLQGHGVFANFTTNEVSVNGANPCCAIVGSVRPAQH
jgi:hypothetical protein